MIRTQVSFDEDQYRTLTRYAADRGISMSAVVREAVATKLREEDRKRINRRALSVIGIARSGSAESIGRDHDRYLDEAYADW